jgi:hypothetical protein
VSDRRWPPRPRHVVVEEPLHVGQERDAQRLVSGVRCAISASPRPSAQQGAGDARRPSRAPQAARLRQGWLERSAVDDVLVPCRRQLPADDLPGLGYPQAERCCPRPVPWFQSWWRAPTRRGVSVSSIRRKPSGRWEARCRDSDGQQRGKTFDTKSAAREFLDRVRSRSSVGTTWTLRTGGLSSSLLR